MHRLFAALSLAATMILPAAAQPLMTPAELATRLGGPDIIVLDIRTGEAGAGAKAYAAGHIPGAVHADYTIAGWRALKDGVTLYLPSPQVFEALAGNLGIANDSHVVIVSEGESDGDFAAAARVYWTFRTMGHAKLSILDGGYRGWQADAARPVSRETPRIEPSLYEVTPDPALRATLADVLAVERTGVALVDSRPPSFFAGKEKHKAVRVAGHIPGAVNQSYTIAFRPGADLKPVADLEQAYASLRSDRPTIVYCNTGHWSATTWFVLSELLGRKNVKLYDGSMLDYAADPARPVQSPKGS